MMSKGRSPRLKSFVWQCLCTQRRRRRFWLQSTRCTCNYVYMDTRSYIFTVTLVESFGEGPSKAGVDQEASNVRLRQVMIPKPMAGVNELNKKSSHGSEEVFSVQIEVQSFGRWLVGMSMSWKGEEWLIRCIGQFRLLEKRSW